MHGRKYLKRKKQFRFVVTIMIISIFLLIGSYAIFTQTMTITGLATNSTQNKLNHQINYYASPWYTRIVTAHANLTRSTETLTDGNTITTSYTRSSNSATNRNLATRFTYTNLNPYTMTTGTITYTDTCTGTVSVATISATSMAYNATITINTTIRLATSTSQNCQFNFTIKYAYSGVNKYMYYIIKIL